jgi:choline dehydrogenase-like flavoprotein
MSMLHFKPNPDVVVVGSGAGGSTVAHRLARHGHRVLIVEQGDFIQQQRADLSTLESRFYPSFTGISVVGGPTKFYGAALYRMRESDFRATQHEAGQSPAWPIDYAELEPYYGEAEELYGVRGSAEGDPSEPPRSRPFPHPAIPHAPRVQRLVDRLRAAGNSVAPIPRAIDYGPEGRCRLCGNCDAYYCPFDAKLDAEIAALRPAMRTGNVDLLTNAECLRVLTDASGTRATGVLIRHQGKEHTIEADVIVICAGLPGSAQLLLKSANSKHPRGLGNAHGCVGRYYGGHSVGLIFPVLSIRQLPPIHAKTFAINTYYENSPDWPYPTGVIQSACQIPFWEEEGALKWWKRRAAEFIGRRSLFCYYMVEALPTRESGFEYDGEKIVRWTPPVQNVQTVKRLRRLAIRAFRRAGCPIVVAPGGTAALWHATGTVCFGSDPESSVLDSDCRVREINNLYVVDGSTLPSAGAVNTGLTILALALRAGDRISAGLSGKHEAAARPQKSCGHSQPNHQ